MLYRKMKEKIKDIRELSIDPICHWHCIKRLRLKSNFDQLHVKALEIPE